MNPTLSLLPECRRSHRPVRRVSLLTLACLLALAAGAAAAQTEETGKTPASPAVAVAAADTVAELPVCGQGAFRYFGFLVYQARLHGACGPQVFERPFSLTLTYARSLSGQDIAQSSVDEIKRLEGDVMAPELLAQWGKEMEKAFPDVVRDDQITGQYDPRNGVRFYHNGRFTHHIDDPRFGQAFFGIWLDPRTRAPALREQLLGERQ